MMELECFWIGTSGIADIVEQKFSWGRQIRAVGSHSLCQKKGIADGLDTNVRWGLWQKMIHNQPIQGIGGRYANASKRRSVIVEHMMRPTVCNALRG